MRFREISILSQKLLGIGITSIQGEVDYLTYEKS